MKTLVFIGSGRVASNLAAGLQAAGHKIAMIFSLHEESCGSLGKKLGVPYSTLKTDIPKADIYICSVQDDAICDAISGIDFGDGVLAHTAGSVDMGILKPYAKNYGVLYPMQTFSKEKAVDFAAVPFYVEGSNEFSTQTLCRLAETISPKVHKCNSLQRRKLHIAAVFACNFTNHMYAIAHKLLAAEGLDFNELLPLIDETAAKVHSLPPAQAQTGPASRHDTKTMQAHLQALNGTEKEIYELLSKSILVGSG